MSLHHRPVSELYLCHGNCGLYKPGAAFIRSDNKSGFVYSNQCNICRHRATGKWLMDYYNKVKNDPVKLLEAIRHFESLRPSAKDGPMGFRYYRWLMAFNSFLSRMGLIDKRKFDITTNVGIKVHRGFITQEEAERRIESYYERHPESRPTNS